MHLHRLIAPALALLAATLPAIADGEVQKLMTAADKKRLAGYGETRKQALAEAGKGQAADRRTLDTLLALPMRSFAGFDMVGAWQCRTIKAGGISPLVVYGWFKCRVSDDGSGWRLQKTTGSQRTVGRFFDDGDKRLIYLGSFFVAGDPVKTYGSGPESDMVGYAFRMGDRHWRIEFPAPTYESKLDILELKR
jgi:hypothetical protein